MGDMGDTFRSVREDGKRRRANNTVSSTQILRDSGIQFESKNFGAHLVVAGRFDFWPSTGRFIERGTGNRGYGVRNLLKKLEAA